MRVLPVADKPLLHCLSAVLATASVALLAWPWHDNLGTANIAMLFLLPVIVAALWLGRGAAIASSVTGILLFDVLFVPPRFSFSVADAKYVVTFAVMLLVALVISHLAERLREQMHAALQREQQTRALCELASRLAGVMTREAVVAAVRNFVHEQLQASAVLLLPDAAEKFVAELDDAGLDHTDRIAATAAIERNAAILTHMLSCGERGGLFVPLRGSTRHRGVLGVVVAHDCLPALDERRALVEAAGAIVATALERLHFVDVAGRAELEMTAERLRSSILSALSHDIRTPLTALYGLAESLLLSDPPLPESAQETLAAMRAQALHMNSLATNLLEMARLQSGRIALHKEWQPLEEIIGASIKQLSHLLAGRRVRVELPQPMPLLQFDAVLMERVLCNLMENAAKYSRAQSDIVIDALLQSQQVEVRVINEGGFSVDDTHSLFDVFVRGDATGRVAGTGVGLAVCRVIVEAHGGSITASNSDAEHACVAFTLPRGTPPVMADDAGGML